MDRRNFINKWNEKISSVKFPELGIDENSNYETITLPPKVLLPGSELFGNFEVNDVDGNTVLQVDSYVKMKYILYASKKNEEIKVPVNEEEISKKVKDYELFINSIIKDIRDDYQTNSLDPPKLNDTINQILNYNNIRRY
ncbi:MAG: hypothetical protein PVH88_19385 [Ignavibacteria bacterium]|jgi:hypothetical protein